MNGGENEAKAGKYGANGGGNKASSGEKEAKSGNKEVTTSQILANMNRTAATESFV